MIREGRRGWFRTGSLIEHKGERQAARGWRKLTAIGLKEGIFMDQDPAAPPEQEPEKTSSSGIGRTIPKSKDGVWITSTPGGSSFEPEEDAPAGDGVEDTGASDKAT